MLNFFKKNNNEASFSSTHNNEETEGVNREDGLESKEIDQLNIIKKEEKGKESMDSETMNQTISDIKEYIKVNGKIDPETIEIMTGTSLEKFLSSLESREDLKIELNLSELKETIKSSLLTLEEPARENWFRKIVNKPLVKASFVALALVFSSEIKASTNSENNDQEDKTEITKKTSQEFDDANTYTLNNDDLEKINTETKNEGEKDFSPDKISVEKFVNSQIEDIKNIIVNKDYDKISSNPYLISALYYSQKFINQISNDKYQTSAAKKIMGQVANLIDNDFREGALQALEEQTKNLEKEQGKKISTTELSPLENLDYGHGINHNDAIDLYTQEGNDITAMKSGIVVLAENGWQEENEISTSSTKGGNSVIVYNYLTKEFFRYVHMEKTSLEPGQLVMEGDKVGIVGHSGSNACKPGHGNHLHLEINKYNSEKGSNESVFADELKQRIENSRTLASN